MLANFEICEHIATYINEIPKGNIDIYELLFFLIDVYNEYEKEQKRPTLDKKTENKIRKIFFESLNGVKIENNYHGFKIWTNDINLNDQTIKTIENNLKNLEKEV